MSGTNNIVCFVEDACGERFLNTLAGPEHEPAFRKHAREWIALKKRPGSYRDKGSQPVMPCRVIVMSQEEFAR